MGKTKNKCGLCGGAGQVTWMHLKGGLMAMKNEAWTPCPEGCRLNKKIKPGTDAFDGVIFEYPPKLVGPLNGPFRERA